MLGVFQRFFSHFQKTSDCREYPPKTINYNHDSDFWFGRLSKSMDMEMVCDKANYINSYKGKIDKGNLYIQFPPRCKLHGKKFDIPMRFNPTVFVSGGQWG